MIFAHKGRALLVDAKDLTSAALTSTPKNSSAGRCAARDGTPRRPWGYGAGFRGPRLAAGFKPALKHYPRSRPRMHDHRTSYGLCISNEQRLDVLCDPGERAPIGLLSLFVFVEDADRGHRVVACIDDVIGHEALDIADDGNGAVFDPACQFLGASGLCLCLTYGGIHEHSLPSTTKLLKGTV